MEIIARGLLTILVALAMLYGVQSWAPSFTGTMASVSGALNPSLTVVDAHGH